MHHPGNENRVALKEIYDPIGPNHDLSNIAALKLGYYATKSRENFEAFARRNQTVNQTHGVGS
ncbi:MAG: hypothetical protein HW416_1223 [Chloroflexi bacterium]|nr:hypothetical protein [Chloroflexota bacterium]